jgi:predicted kinase
MPDDKAIPGGRPLPNALHVDDANKKDEERQAINYVMARDQVPYPEAKKRVAAQGAAKLLAQREGSDKDAHAKNVAAHALETRLKIPGETSKFLLELNDRVSALEAASSAKAPEEAA